MTGRCHVYPVTVTWTGNAGRGTATIAGYARDHVVTAAGKPPLFGSSDPAFRGDTARWNPEELLVASLVACHHLWFLALCAQAGVIVTAYVDAAEGLMTEEADGAGQFSAVTLRPRVTLATPDDAARIAGLHERAHAMCFIARSVNFPVRIEGAVTHEAPLA